MSIAPALASENALQVGVRLGRPVLGLLLAQLLGAQVAQAQAASAQLLSPSWGDEAGWREMRLGAQLPPNQFTALPASATAAAVLRVSSNASMSLWARPLQADLARTPVLCWRWRISAPLVQADMARKAGDDYAARLYVAFQVPPKALGWATRAQLAIARQLYGPGVPDAALNYVWDNRHPEGHRAPNAYTAQAQMVVQRSGPKLASQWVQERRDLRRDAQAWLPPGAQPVSIAVTADTDNTGEAVVAEFAELKLVAQDADCATGSLP